MRLPGSEKQSSSRPEAKSIRIPKKYTFTLNILYYIYRGFVDIFGNLSA